MKKRILTILLTLTAIMCLASMSVFAEESGATPYDVWVGGVQVTSANEDDITSAINAVTPNAASGTATYDPSRKTLTLEGFVYSGKGSLADIEYGYTYNAAIVAQEDLNIVLIGSNSIDANKGDDVDITNCYGIYVIKI